MPSRSAEVDQAETIANLALGLGQTTVTTLDGAGSAFNAVPVTAPSGAGTVVFTSPNIPVTGAGIYSVVVNVEGATAAGFTAAALVVQMSVNGGAFADIATGAVAGQASASASGGANAVANAGVKKAGKVNFRVQVTPLAGGATALVIPNPDGTLPHAGAVLSWIEMPAA